MHIHLGLTNPFLSPTVPSNKIHTVNQIKSNTPFHKSFLQSMEKMPTLSQLFPHGPILRMSPQNIKRDFKRPISSIERVTMQEKSTLHQHFKVIEK